MVPTAFVAITPPPVAGIRAPDSFTCTSLDKLTATNAMARFEQTMKMPKMKKMINSLFVLDNLLATVESSNNFRYTAWGSRPSPV